MPTASKRISLPAPARAFLLDQLESIGHGRHDHRGDPPHIAVTFRPRRRGRDGLPDRLVPLDAFRLLALAQGRSRGRRGRRRLALAVYRPAFDPHAAGDIAFGLERVHDLADPGALTWPQPNATAIRSAVALHHALEDASPVTLDPGLLLPRLYFAYQAERAPAFEPGPAVPGSPSTAFGPGPPSSSQAGRPPPPPRTASTRPWPTSRDAPSATPPSPSADATA